jgi:hypothetical protein
VVFSRGAANGTHGSPRHVKRCTTTLQLSQLPSQLTPTTLTSIQPGHKKVNTSCYDILPTPYLFHYLPHPSVSFRTMTRLWLNPVAILGSLPRLPSLSYRRLYLLSHSILFYPMALCPLHGPCTTTNSLYSCQLYALYFSLFYTCNPSKLLRHFCSLWSQIWS